MSLQAGWRTATLGEVARWGSGGTPKAGTPEYYGGDIPWAVIGDLSDGPIGATANHITPAGLEASSAKRVPAGAVLVAMYGSIGKLGLTAFELTTNQAIAFAVPDPELVEARFLFYYLLSQREALSAAGKGATQKNIGQGTLKAWPIPLPPLLEQRRIVDRLEDQLSHLEAGAALLKLARARRRAALAASVGQLARASDGTRSLTLADLSRGGLFCDGDWVESKDQDPAGTVRLTQLADVGTGEFRHRSDRWMRMDQALGLNCTFLREGDLLIARMPEPLARTCQVPAGLGDAVTAVDVAVLRLARTDVRPAWVMWALNGEDFRRRAVALQTGSTRKRISRMNLSTLTLDVPTLDEQDARLTRHLAVVEGLERLEAEVQRAEARSRQLRRQILATAFSGRRRYARTTDMLKETVGV
jgi:hypothetical protein